MTGSGVVNFPLPHRLAQDRRPEYRLRLTKKLVSSRALWVVPILLLAVAAAVPVCCQTFSVAWHSYATVQKTHLLLPRRKNPLCFVHLLSV